MKQNPNSETPGAIDVLKAMAQISVILAAGLFLLGWSYLYGYYRGFGLSPNEFGFSPQIVVVYALPVIRSRTFLITFIVSAVLLLVLSRFRAIGAFLSSSVVILVTIAVAALVGSPYATKLGHRNAQRDAILTTSTLPFVKLEGSGESTQGGCSLEDWNYKLLLRANGQTYVILPLDNIKGISSANLRVCSFPDSIVKATRIQVGLDEK